MALIAMGFGLLLPWHVSAAILSGTAWAVSSGHWNDLHWNNGVPISGTSAFIDNGGTATVTSGVVQDAYSVVVGGDLVASALMIVDGGRITDRGALIGSMETATVSGVGSTWTSSHDLNVQAFDGPAQSGSVGTVEVSGEGSAWTSSSILYIGRGGDGALTILGGSRVSNEFYASIGEALGSAGSVAVSGAGSTWTNSGNLDVGVQGAGAASPQAIDHTRTGFDHSDSRITTTPYVFFPTARGRITAVTGRPPT
ncbi:MAG: outer rane autotransporter barrel protein [Rariglobus sp.]|jgi:T5SS/PEP-CTERM-associated repeat protein|nr:outer rane autotransporter barrel protein [Rariglobus sp.]